MKKSIFATTALALGVALSLGANAVPAPHLASWEIAGQFHATQNPFEVWTYGYKAAADCNGALIPFSNKTTQTFGSNINDWWMKGTTTGSQDLPMVGQSKGVTSVSPVKFSPNGITMHPGPSGECAVVRFTAPIKGAYRLTGRFWAQNITAGGTNSRPMVVVKNNISTPIAAGNVTAPAGTTNLPFNGSVALAAGDTIDFMVGSNGSFLNDSTGLHGFIMRMEP